MVLGMTPFLYPWNSEKTFGEMQHKKKILLRSQI